MGRRRGKRTRRASRRPRLWPASCMSKTTSQMSSWLSTSSPLRPGITLLSAMQASVGLELAREHRPALILLDLNLPDMGGLEVLRSLRGDPATEGIPVVVVSADASPGQSQRLLAAGASGYLTKPYEIASLLELIDVHCVSGHPGGPQTD